MSDDQADHFEWTSLQPFLGHDVAICFDVVGCQVRSKPCGCLWCVPRCHVKSCHVLRCEVMHVLHCDGMWCGARRWDLMSSWCDVAGSDVTLCGSKWLCEVNWKMIWCSVLHRSTPYYTALQSITPILLHVQHFALWLCTQLSPNAAPATKSDTPGSTNAAPATKSDAHHWLSCHMNVIYNAESNAHHLPTSPNTAPAMQNPAHHCLSWHMKLLLTCYWAVTELLLSCYWTVTELLLSCY